MVGSIWERVVGEKIILREFALEWKLLRGGDHLEGEG